MVTSTPLFILVYTLYKIVSTSVSIVLDASLNNMDVLNSKVATVGLVNMDGLGL